MKTTDINRSISVIVPVYNQELYIGRCLRSLISQNFPNNNYEIIVVDDGSNDKTPYALSQFAGPNEPKVIIHSNKKNLGLPASLNIAIQISSSPYIVRVDSDDFVNSNFLNFLHYYLCSNPRADAVACDYLLVDDNENAIRRVSSNEFPIACGILFKKSHLIDIGLYDETFLKNEDRDLRIRFERKYLIEHLPLPLYRYRRHDNNITNDTESMSFYNDLLLSKHNDLNYE